MLRQLAIALLITGASSVLLECAEQDDGVYGEDCSLSVVVCHNGVDVPSACPSGTLYSGTFARCLPFDSEAQCRQGGLAEPQREAVTVCDDKASGVHSTAHCSPAFAACLNGNTHSLLCPDALMFDETTGTCEEESRACVANRTSSSPSLAHSSAGPPLIANDEEIVPVDITEEQAIKVCSDRGVEGFFAVECSTQFVACHAGRVTIMQCPADLAYDEEHKMCEYPGNVVACGGVAPGTEEGSGTDGSGVEGSGDGSGVEGTGEGSGVDGSGIEASGDGSGIDGSGIDGSGEGSGIEGSGIEEGSAIDRGSGEGSGDEASGEEDVQNGSGSGEEGSGESIVTPVTDDRLSQEDIIHFCGDRVDGFYRVQQCSEQFVGCSGGVAWLMSCPASLLYDEDKEMCDYPGNVLGCGDDETDQELASDIERKIQSIDEEERKLEKEEEKELEEWEGLEEKEEEVDKEAKKEEVKEEKEQNENETVGTTEDALLDETTTVEEEEPSTTTTTLPESTTTSSFVRHGKNIRKVSVKQAKQSDIKKNDVNVDAFGHGIDGKDKMNKEGPEVDVDDENTEIASTTEKKRRAHRRRHHGEKEKKREEEQPKLVYDDSIEATSCGSRPDGFYQLGCSNEMLTCSGGVTRIMNCPEDLIFDEERQICEFPAHVSACLERSSLLEEDGLLTEEKESPPRIETATASMTPSATPATTPESVETHRAMRRRQTSRDPECRHPEGFFSIGCGAEFVACSEGKAIKVSCREGETLDEIAQGCVPVSRHPQCFDEQKASNMDERDDDVEMKKEEDNEEDLDRETDASFPCDKEGSSAASECSDFFTLCEGGRGMTLYCLQGFLFDQHAQRCVPAVQLKKCRAH